MACLLLVLIISLADLTESVPQVFSTPRVTVPQVFPPTVTVPEVFSPGARVPGVFSPGRSCSLVRSSARSGGECFSEPECRQECNTVNQQQCANEPASARCLSSPAASRVIFL